MRGKFRKLFLEKEKWLFLVSRFPQARTSDWSSSRIDVDCSGLQNNAELCEFNLVSNLWLNSALRFLR